MTEYFSPKEIKRMDKFVALAIIAARQAVSNSGISEFDAWNKNRTGTIISTGIGVLVMEELEHAKRRNARIYAEIVGYATNCDAYHVTAPSPDGEGAACCMQLALSDAGVNPSDIDYINAHGTSTKLNDSCETKAVRKAFGKHADKIMMSSTKSMTGHLLGASGAIEAI